MKVTITCTRCGSNDVSIISDKDSIPMYKCNKCGYKKDLFPRSKNKEDTEDEE